MTFINTPKETEIQDIAFETEIKEEKRFKSLMVVGVSILLLPIFYLAICAFLPVKQVDKDVVSASVVALDTKFVSSRIEAPKETINLLTENIIEPKNEILKLVEEKNIFHVSSTKPEGFYVMVGSFSEFKNAEKLQKMNPTDYKCYIFELNYKMINRVGLYISEKDMKKAENALVEIRNMQPESWLLYNSFN